MRAFALIMATALGVAQSSFAIAGTPTSRDLALEVWLNGRPRQLDVHVYEKDGALWIEQDDLPAIGIKGDAGADRQGTLVQLNGIKGVNASVAESDQRLMISAAADSLAPTTIDLHGRQTSPATEMPAAGIVAAYDVAATESDALTSHRQTAVNAALSLTAFSSFGTFSTTGFARLDPQENQAVRLDSTATFDDPPTLRRLSLGDSISGGLSWSRPVRFGGVQLARDFSLQPDLVTMPLPDFFGDSTVPGSVDVFVGASKVFSGELEPGPFEVRDLPVVNGAGQATVVVRDLLGHETTRVFDLYASSQMLAAGLTSYSIDAGLLRQSYGVASFDYGDAVAEGTLRYGLRDSITLEAHAEASPEVAMAGVGGIIALSSYGTVQLGVAESAGDRGTGTSGSISLQSQLSLLNLYAAFEASTPRFLDVGATDGALPARQTLQLGAGLNLERYGSVGVSFVRVERPDEDRVSLVTASYILSFGSGLTFGLTSVYNAEDDSLAAETFFSMPLGGDLTASASLSRDGNALEGRVSLEKPANPDGGFGYRLQASDGAVTNFNAEADWRGQHAIVEARLASVDGRVSAQLEATGAVVAVDDAVFLTRPVDGAFALVSTGQEGVGIYRENREVARADSDGEALLTGLVPFARNRLAIEPRDYDMAQVLDRTDLEVVPGRGGIVVDFTPKPQTPVLLVVMLPDGSFPPVGSTVRFAGGGDPWIVGHHGSIFIADLHLPLEAVIELPSGSCRFKLTSAPAPTPGDIPHVGPLSCVKDN